VTASPSPESASTRIASDPQRPAAGETVPRRRWVFILALAAAIGLLSFDVARPPSSQHSARFLVGSIHLYQSTVSPGLMRIGVRCRFTPSCSHYAEVSIRERGTLVGVGRSAWRLLRCGPWTPRGTVDPP